MEMDVNLLVKKMFYTALDEYEKNCIAFGNNRCSLYKEKIDRVRRHIEEYLDFMLGEGEATHD